MHYNANLNTVPAVDLSADPGPAMHLGADPDPFFISITIRMP